MPIPPLLLLGTGAGAAAAALAAAAAVALRSGVSRVYCGIQLPASHHLFDELLFVLVQLMINNGQWTTVDQSQHDEAKKTDGWTVNWRWCEGQRTRLQLSRHGRSDPGKQQASEAGKGKRSRFSRLRPSINPTPNDELSLMMNQERQNLTTDTTHERLNAHTTHSVATTGFRKPVSGSICKGGWR